MINWFQFLFPLIVYLKNTGVTLKDHPLMTELVSDE